MAGITGLIIKDGNIVTDEHLYAFNKMLNKLTISDKQFKSSLLDSKVFMGNVTPISSKKNDRIQHNRFLNVSCVIDGLVFISEDERKKVVLKYSIDPKLSNYELLPYLYDLNKEDIVYHITGWYNIFFFNTNKNEWLLFNDRLGYLPLFVYEDASHFIFASKIECILESGLLPKVQIDNSTVAEHLLFNYPVSDMTYIKGIETLPNAYRMCYKKANTKRGKYWNLGELYGQKALSRDDSYQLFNNSLRKTILKAININEDIVNMSFTAGWDSRLVLSYLKEDYGNRLNLYSFGSEKSEDILIPEMISKRENLFYTPFILDEYYLQNEFVSLAVKTIMLSNGSRNYKRAHYLFAMEKLAKVSDLSIAGIYGDEITKATKPKEGEVISFSMIDFIDHDMDVDYLFKEIRNGTVFTLFKEDSYLPDEIFHRLQQISNDLNKFSSIEEKYYSFRFETNLRKYFGAEVNGYNDFSYSFSPFIDYDFLTNYAKTCYFVPRFDYYSSSLILKRNSTKLYADLIIDNYPKLARYNTSRGYSMKDSKKLTGLLKILYHRKMKKKSKDGYNVNPTDDIFLKMMQQENVQGPYKQILECLGSSNIKTEVNNSLSYWISSIMKRYA